MLVSDKQRAHKRMMTRTQYERL